MPTQEIFELARKYTSEFELTHTPTELIGKSPEDIAEIFKAHYGQCFINVSSLVGQELVSIEAAASLCPKNKVVLIREDKKAIEEQLCNAITRFWLQPQNQSYILVCFRKLTTKEIRNEYVDFVVNHEKQGEQHLSNMGAQNDDELVGLIDSFIGALPVDVRIIFETALTDAPTHPLGKDKAYSAVRAMLSNFCRGGCFYPLVGRKTQGYSPREKAFAIIRPMLEDYFQEKKNWQSEEGGFGKSIDQDGDTPPPNKS